jgi:DNA-binding response OmpR family regulator
MTMVVTFITCSGVSIEQEPVMSEKRMHDSNVILLVEDEQRILRFMSISLKAAGYRVITATTGEQALDLVQSEKPDIVLLDIFLPGMSGLEALRKLRTYSQLPVIIISARDSMGPEALALGANEFLAKPFKPVDLIQRIKAVLKK